MSTKQTREQGIFATAIGIYQNINSIDHVKEIMTSCKKTGCKNKKVNFHYIEQNK